MCMGGENRARWARSIPAPMHEGETCEHGSRTCGVHSRTRAVRPPSQVSGADRPLTATVITEPSTSARGTANGFLLTLRWPAPAQGADGALAVAWALPWAAGTIAWNDHTEVLTGGVGTRRSRPPSTTAHCAGGVRATPLVRLGGSRHQLQAVASTAHCVSAEPQGSRTPLPRTRSPPRGSPGPSATATAISRPPDASFGIRPSGRIRVSGPGAVPGRQRGRSTPGHGRRTTRVHRRGLSRRAGRGGTRAGRPPRPGSRRR